MIKLSPRLKTIAELVPDDSNIVDIGCDHGLLDIYLTQSKKNITIIASDINQNALNNAIKNIKKEKLTSKIKTVLSDGLDNIDTKNIDTIVISGMGSHTITKILLTNSEKIKHIDTLIIQSNNDLAFLREQITKMNYYIEDEKLVSDNKKIYTIIKFKRGKKRYSYKELLFGPVLLKNKTKLFHEKNNQELKTLELIYPKIPKGHISYKIKTFFKIKMYKKILLEKTK